MPAQPKPKESSAEFSRLVRDALARLYDTPYVQNHPLATELGPDVRGRLLAAIDALKPPPSVSEKSRSWRAYRLMQLRYVEAQDPTDVQRVLGLTKSPYYVEHERAVTALTDTLWRELHGGDEPLPGARPRSILRRWAPAGGAALAVMLIALALAAVRLSPGSLPRSPSHADDFSDPATGLFFDHQSGVALPPGSDPSTAVSWDYAYQEDALVVHLNSPAGPSSERRGAVAHAPVRLAGNFAAEVRATATRSAGQAEYGLAIMPGDRELRFGVEPGPRTYDLFELFRPPSVNAKSPAIQGGSAENIIRIEALGDTVRLWINGQQVDQIQDGWLGARPASVGLMFFERGVADEAQVEMRFRDFRIYS